MFMTSDARREHLSRVLRGWHVFPVFALVGLVVPALSSPSALFTWATVLVWALFATGTNVAFGWVGLLSFGQAAFFGVGGYAVGILHDSYPDLTAPVPLLIGAAVAAMIAVVFAAGALRTSGAEFAVLTLVLAQVFWLLTYRLPVLRGDEGFTGLSDVQILGAALVTDVDLWVYTVVVVALCFGLLWLLHRSSLAAFLRAVRDDPWRAAALGVRVRRSEIIAFAIAAAFSAVAGGLMVQLQGVASPALLHFSLSGEVLVACMIGGTGIFWGPAIGAAVLVWAQHLLGGTVIPPGLLVGALLVLIVLTYPGGLAELSRIRWWPFRRSVPPGAAPASPTPVGPGGAHPDAAVDREEETVDG